MSQNRLYIRADMNEQIATGHVMRCLAIADAARMEGIETVFLSADRGPETLIQGRGYDLIELGTRWDDMDSELKMMEELIREYRIDSLLIDSYQVTESYLKAMSRLTKVCYLDDLNRVLYPVDSLICYALYSDSFHYRERYPHTQLMLGPAFAPLRKEFCGIGKKEIRDSVQDVLILSGGTDSYGALSQILEALDTDKYSSVTAICGRLNPDYESLAGTWSGKQNVHVIKAADMIVDHMVQADLCITAAGTTLYELCACGVPAVSYVLADNQILNAETFAKKGLIPCIGDARKRELGDHLSSVIDSLEGKEVRGRISEKMQSLVDGCGARRVVNALINSALAGPASDGRI